MRGERVILMRGNRKLWLLLLAVAMTALLFSNVTAVAEDLGTNLLEDGDFENGEGIWYHDIWDNTGSEISIDSTVSHSGNNSIKIVNTKENDARIVQDVMVSENSFYRITAYVKTENVLASTSSTTRVGATISILNTYHRSGTVTGTQDWTQISFVIKTGDGVTELPVCITLGGYSATTEGTLWIDDVEMVEIDSADEYTLISGDSGTSSSSHWAGRTLIEGYTDIKWTLFATMWIVFGLIYFLTYVENDELRTDDKKLTKLFWCVIGFGLVFRLVVGVAIYGFSYDVSCFMGWSQQAATDLFGMYQRRAEGAFLDYPPLYMYVLAPLGGLTALLQGAGLDSLASLVIKMPSILADLVTAIILFYFTRRKLNTKWAFFVALAYVTNPAVWINSTAWGQVDSFFAMLVVADLILLEKKQWCWSGVMFVLMVLLKPHGIIFAPVIGMVLLMQGFAEKNWGALLKAVGCGIATCVVLLLPFALRMEGNKITWVFELYSGTISNYSYATLNGFNFWAMLNKNSASDASLFLGVPIHVWGMIAIGVAIGLTILFVVMGMRKGSTNKKSAIFISALVVMMTVFTFVHKMHERYLFPAVVLAFLAFVQSRDKGFLYLAFALTVHVFLNHYMILNYNLMYEYCHPAQGDKMVIFLGFVEVCLYIWTMVVSWRVLKKKAPKVPKSLRDLPPESDALGAAGKA